MTPATKLLKDNKIDFSIHEYEHDANAKSFGLEAAEKLNLRVEEVFKTLLARLRSGDSANERPARPGRSGSPEMRGCSRG